MKLLLYALVSLVSMAFATMSPETSSEAAAYRSAIPQATLASVSVP